MKEDQSHSNTLLKSATERVHNLRAQINDYRYHYHVLDESTMSEAAADSLKHELAGLEAQYPELITPDSPTQRVAGSPSSKFKKITHSQRMLSLNDVFNREEVTAWVHRIGKLISANTSSQTQPIQRDSVASLQANFGALELFADTKMDGLACAITYLDGVFIQAVTRGDGTVGEDVTANVRTIESVPLRLRSAPGFEQFLVGRTEIRGEIVMLESNFAKLNEANAAEGRPLFANPRNLAAGTIRQLDPKLVAARPLNFFGYDVLRDDPAEVPTNAFAYQMIRALGLAANARATTFMDVSELMKFIDHWETARKSLPFHTDGLVVKVNDRSIFRALGVVGKAPRAAIAYKYAAEEATTVVKDIVISIGRTGAATPIATFDPVVVAGTTVQHASLHNADEITRLDLRIGDTVIIYKAGDIIPKVQMVLTKLRPAATKPFVYEAELRRQYPELEFERPEGEVVWRVKGATGPLLLKKSLEHFASKSALDIDTLGEKNVAAIVEAGLVSDAADIYKLTKDEVLRLDRFAEISAQKLIEGIHAKKHPELPRFMYGLGIRHVGEQTARDLAAQFGTIEALARATVEDLDRIDGIGTIVAESILAYFADDDNQALLEKFSHFGVVPPAFQTSTGSLTGVSFVITGTLGMGSRDEVAARLVALGAREHTSVTKDTTYLIVGDSPGENKLTKAKKLNTTILSEDEVVKLL